MQRKNSRQGSFRRTRLGSVLANKITGAVGSQWFCVLLVAWRNDKQERRAGPPGDEEPNDKNHEMRCTRECFNKPISGIQTYEHIVKFCATFYYPTAKCDDPFLTGDYWDGTKATYVSPRCSACCKLSATAFCEARRTYSVSYLNHM